MKFNLLIIHHSSSTVVPPSEAIEDDVEVHRLPIPLQVVHNSHNLVALETHGRDILDDLLKRDGPAGIEHRIKKSGKLS